MVKFQDHPRWSTRQARWCKMEQLQDPRCGSTRPQAFDEAASGPPAVVDSSTALAFMRRGRAGGLTTYCLCTPGNAKEM